MSTASSPGKQRGAKAGAEPEPEGDSGLIAVILRKDVPRLGRRGDVVQAKRGLMRHKLYPGAQAAYATPENVALYTLPESERQSTQLTDEQQQARLLALIKSLDKKAVVVSRRPRPDDPERFAASEPAVTPRLIRAAVRRQLGIALHESHLMLEGSIAAYGSFKVPLNLRLPDGRQTELTLHIDRRGGSSTPQARAEGKMDGGA